MEIKANTGEANSRFRIASFALSKNALAYVKLELKKKGSGENEGYEVIVESSAYNAMDVNPNDPPRVKAYLQNIFKGTTPDMLKLTDVVIDKRCFNHIIMAPLLAEAGFNVLIVSKPENLYEYGTVANEKLWDDFPEIASKYVGHHYESREMESTKLVKALKERGELEEDDKPKKPAVVHRKQVFKEMRIAVNIGVQCLQRKLSGQQITHLLKPKDEPVAVLD